MIYNDSYAQLLGARHPAALGRPFAAVWHEAWPQIAPLFALADAGQAGDEEEIRLTLPRSGAEEAAHFAFSVTPVRGDHGRVEGLFCTCTETMGRLRAEQALAEESARLRESEAWMRSVSNTLPGYIWTANPAGLLNFTTQAWLDYAGTTFASTLGAGWSRFVHPDDLLRVSEAWSRAVRTGTRYDIEFRCRRHDGKFRWFLVRANPIRTEAGAIERWVGINVDVEAQKQAETALSGLNATLEQRVADASVAREQMEGALRQAQKMEAIGQLTGGIAHDFNNMLQSVLGSLDLIRPRLQQGRTSEVARLVDIATEGANRAATLTGRLLSFARRQALVPRPLDANALVSGMAELLRNTVGKGVTLTLDLAPSLPRVLCDANQLESALLNLAINARDAMPEGGTLLIATTEARVTATEMAGHPDVVPGRFVQISVTDTGAGMTPSVAERAFEPFYTTKPLGRGTGLGLSQLYGFVRQSGGLVHLVSRPGHGTTVTLQLPLFHGEIIADRPEPSPHHLPARRGTVLLVEDEESVRTLAREALVEQGWAVFDAATGTAALTMLQAGNDVDVLVTDVGLPGGLNGRQLAEAARQIRPTLPVLFITGHAYAELSDGPMPPLTAVIMKPFHLSVLVSEVAAMFA